MANNPKEDQLEVELEKLYFRAALLQDQFDTTGWWQWFLRRRIRKRVAEIHLSIVDLEINS